MFKIKNLAFCGLLIALATVTSFIKIFSFPFGGSVTLLSMLFVVLAGYFYGPKLGILTAIVYGLLQLVIEPQIYYPMQVLMDYILAFGVLGTAGFFYKLFGKKNYAIAVSGAIVTFLRYVCHILSGLLIWGVYAPEGQSVWAYSVIYNGTYMVPEIIITVICLTVITPFLSKSKNQL